MVHVSAKHKHTEEYNSFALSKDHVKPNTEKAASVQ